jgi:DtxR family Mn-dependent transcriptional regulator
MEPGISDVVFERMRAAVAGVDRCPHGNPIPGTPAAALPIDDLTPLEDCDTGTRVRIDRIREDLELDLDMLRYLEEYKLLPGTELDVSDRDPEGAVTVSRGGDRIAVGPALASHVLCVPA